MAPINKKYARQQLKRYLSQKSNLANIKTTVDQRKQLTAFYDKEIAFWKGWVDRFQEIDQDKANNTSVTFETVI